MTTITVNAAANLAAGSGPQFNLLLDGKQVARGTASSTAATNYTFNVADPTPGQSHTVGVQYTNDKTINGQDRNLLLRSITVNGNTVAATSTSETYVAPGVGTYTGDGNMYWNGTATFSLPASDFPAPAPAPAPAPTSTTFYVSSSGSDSGDGSASHPFATLAKAQAAMEASSTIKTATVEGGAYTLGSTLDLTAKDNGETFIAASGQTPVLDGGGSLTDMVHIDGAQNVTLQGLTFQNSGASSGGSAGEVVINNGASGANITANHFLNAGSDALMVSNSSKTTVSGNEFDNSGQAAIEDYADCTSGNDTGGTSGDVIDSNIVNGSGWGHGAIYIHGTTGAQVTHNTVENTQGIGIDLEAIGGYQASPTLYCQNSGTVVSGNIVQNVDQGQTDAGAIYVIDRTGQDTGIQITGNEVNGASNSGAFEHIVGIYLDDYTSGVTVSGNIVRGAQDNAVELHGGKDDSFSDDIFDVGNNTTGAILLQSPPSNITPNSGAQGATNDSLSHDIVYATGSSPIAYDDFGINPLPSLTSNLYWDPNGSFGGQIDQSATVGNPQFVNASGNNYALGSGSAASQIGFTPINQSAMGPHPTGAHWF